MQCTKRLKVKTYPVMRTVSGILLIMLKRMGKRIWISVAFSFALLACRVWAPLIKDEAQLSRSKVIAEQMSQVRFVDFRKGPRHCEHFLRKLYIFSSHGLCVRRCSGLSWRGIVSFLSFCQIQSRTSYPQLQVNCLLGWRMNWYGLQMMRENVDCCLTTVCSLQSRMARREG